MAEIVLEHVNKTYPDGGTAVKDLNVTIADGEFLILVGPSGCGKTTTLNMIAGLEDISSGELRIGGERVNEKAPKDRDIAMVFQSYALYPHMTVRQNIAFPLTLAKMKKPEIAQKVEETAKILDLTELLNRRPSQLSGGQRQRVAMGRTSRCPTLTPSCGCRCAARSPGCSASWAPPPSTSRTTRPRR
jgi:multiple sugar transport system ATP-binding protein